MEPEREWIESSLDNVINAELFPPLLSGNDHSLNGGVVELPSTAEPLDIV
jgi:hypothetical protein